MKKSKKARNFLAAARNSISTRMRLSFGLSCFTATAILFSQFIGIMPDPNKSKMDARKLQTETLAIAGSAIAEGGKGLGEFNRMLTNTMKRAEQIRSIGLRDIKSGKLQMEVGNHVANWTMPENNNSNDRFMFVPIFRGAKQIAQLEMCYEPLVSYKSILWSPTTRMALFVFGLSFFFFYLMLYRTLKQLDPRGAIPRRVREAFDTMAEGLLILDRKGRIMLANSKFGSLVGVEADRLTASLVEELPWQLPSGRLPWHTATEEQTPVSDAVVKIADAGNVERTFMVSAAPVLGQDGTARGVIVTFDDITLLEDQKLELIKARKAADEANEAKTNFLSRMSHEIRTPMNAIIGYTDILQQGDVNSQDQVRYLTTIQSSGEHLLDLINDILDLSKVEAGQMTLERRQVEIVSILTNVVDTLNVKASQKNLYLSLEIDGQIPHQVETDDTRLRQVLINTIGNAIKFTNEGGIKIVTRFIEIKSRSMLQFDVIDSGIGMSEVALKTIFDPFTQADDSVTRRFGGTGLGLAISKQISEMLGGGISVKSQEGVGTCFTITVDPGVLVDDIRWVTNESLATEQNKQPAISNTETKFKSGHILIVDDSKANRDMATVMLKRVGLTSDMAVNGHEALEKISKTNYDVVLMDMNMPVMDGMTATQHIRKGGSTIPVIALTALAIESEKQKCLDAGCNAFLGKPMRSEALVGTLSNYLESFEVERTISQSKRSDMRDSSTSDTHPVVIWQTGFPLPDVVVSTLPDDEEFNSIVADFAEILPGKLGEIQSALDTGAIDQLKKLAHWLAGSSGTVGLEPFVAPSRAIENFQGGDHEQLVGLVQHLRELASRVQIPNLSNKNQPIEI